MVDDYFRLITEMLRIIPTNLTQSPLLASIFQGGLVGLSLDEKNALGSVVAFYRQLLDIAASVNGYNASNSSVTELAAAEQNANIVTQLFRECGSAFFNILFQGLISHYNWDIIPDVASILKTLSQILPKESSEWIVAVITNIPEETISANMKNDFLQSYVR